MRATQGAGRRFARAITTAFLVAACAGATAAQPDAATECVAQPPGASDADYLRDIAIMDDSLGIPRDYAQTKALSPEPVASVLVDAGRDVRGRLVRLAPTASAALRAMSSAAARDGVALRLVSGYRSPEYQASLLRGKLHEGMTVESALRINAAPGYSEHHTGCAVDLTTPGSKPTDVSFARTPAYRWLTAHAGDYGFHLSYPQGNPHGIEFEPWHWRYVGPGDKPALDRHPGARTSPRT